MCESGGAVAIKACPLMFSSLPWARTIKYCMWSMHGRSRLERHAGQNELSKVKEMITYATDQKDEENKDCKELKKGIIVGVEEKDRACGRTLEQSLCRSDHSPVRFEAGHCVALALEDGS